MTRAIIVNCEAIRTHMLQDEQASVPIELCYNGVDSSQFYPKLGPKPTFLGGAPFVIGAVCALRPEKSLELLQQAFAQVCHLRPGCKLLIVGSGPELGKLQENAHHLAIHESSIFIPATASVVDYLHTMDIFVLCSRSEAFSNALLEAMASGCCPIGSRVGGTPEMIGERGDRGLLFESGNAADLADKLASVMIHPERAAQLAANASAYVRETFSAEKNVKRTEQIYSTYLETH